MATLNHNILNIHTHSLPLINNTTNTRNATTSGLHSNTQQYTAIHAHAHTDKQTTQPRITTQAHTHTQVRSSTEVGYILKILTKRTGERFRLRRANGNPVPAGL